MQLTPGLTKENCFNELQQKYPKAMAYFCKWIDLYKAAVGWDRLIMPKMWINDEGEAIEYPGRGARRQWTTEKYKFHQLPYNMQLGIILEFIAHNNAAAVINIQWGDGLDIRPLLEDCLRFGEEMMLSEMEGQ